MLSVQKPSIKVLNERDKDLRCVKSAVDISKDLQKLMLRLKGEFMSDDGRGVKYEDLKKSSVFKQYEDQAAGLRNVDLTSLNEQEKMAFFINVYNAMTIHGLVQGETLPESVLDVQQFWKNTSYHIGGHVFSLDDIEHGILRGNKPHPGSVQPLFKADDPRLPLTMKKLDPRLHFALVCGAKGCPAINVYTADNLNKGLEAATKSFCGQEIKLYEMRKEIHVSQIFQWYCGDFGNDDVEALKWTLPYLSDENKRVMTLLLHTLVEEGMVDVHYREYDWKINKM